MGIFSFCSRLKPERGGCSLAYTSQAELVSVGKSSVMEAAWMWRLKGGGVRGGAHKRVECCSVKLNGWMIYDSIMVERFLIWALTTTQYTVYSFILRSLSLSETFLLQLAEIAVHQQGLPHSLTITMNSCLRGLRSCISVSLTDSAGGDHPRNCSSKG